MKTRDGFVSNSSSSSFVVPTGRNGFCVDVDAIDDIDNELSVLETRALIEYGFKPVGHCYATDIQLGVKPKKTSLKKATNLVYDVFCNQDEVIKFLVKLDVSFVASCHYGHETAFFRRGWRLVKYFTNFGIEREMHGNFDEADGSNRRWKRSESVKKIKESDE